MLLRQLGVVLMVLVVPMLAICEKPKPCLSADEASHVVNKEVCVSAHVYDVVQSPDGTRFLDICAPETPDDACRFTIVSRSQDRDEVGELGKFRNADVQVRGFVRPMRGRFGMELSHERQFHGGPPRFRPNPRLAHGFNGEQERPAISDPNLRSHGGRRAFMNTRNQETLPQN